MDFEKSQMEGRKLPAGDQDVYKRQGKCHAIDRQKFDALMHGGNSLPTSA